jgi:phosphomannomutase
MEMTLDKHLVLKYASFDGDADRLIYFWKDADKALVIDGDKQFALLSLYIAQQLKTLSLPGDL